MKSNLLLVLFFFSLNFNLFAQEFNKQYSIKASTWIENKIEFPSSPFQITIKTLSDNSNKRFSAGVNFGASYSEGLQTSLNTNLRFGKEKFTDFGKEQKWRLFYGLDYLAGINSNLNSSWRIANIRLGIAPFAGLQYRINKRLVIHTETNYEFKVEGFVSNRRGLQARIRTNLIPLGSIWLGYELYKN